VSREQSQFMAANNVSVLLNLVGVVATSINRRIPHFSRYSQETRAQN